MADPSFPCTLVIDVPFPTARLADIALQALSVDKELSPSVRRSFSLRAAAGEEDGGDDDGSGATKTIMHTVYEATTNRMLRVSVNAFLDHLGLVVQVMEGLDVDECSRAAETRREDEPTA